MKLIKRIAAACAALMLLSSCSVLQNLGSSSAASTGSSTGAAISAVYNILKATGGIDLSNLTNIINIGKILTGANALTGATSAYTDEFATGLIKGSSSLVNSGNVASVLTGLQSLSGIDTSALTAAAAAGKSLAATSATTDPNIKATVSALTSLMNTLK